MRFSPEIVPSGNVKGALGSIGRGMPYKGLSARLGMAKARKAVLGAAKSGDVRFRFFCSSRDIERMYSGKGVKDKGLWNVLGYERDMKKDPEIDFMDKSSRYHRMKMDEKMLYLDLFGSFLRGLKRGSRIADIGGGIGRFAIGLAKEGHHVHLLDGCRSNLEAAFRHALEDGAEGNMEFSLSDLHSMPHLEDRSFDAVLGIEMLCYTTKPERTLEEIKRVLKPGGTAVLSVENLYGSLLFDAGMTAAGVKEAIRKSSVEIRDSVYTKYYTKDGFRKLLEGAGFRVMLLEGSQFVAEGMFHRLKDSGHKEVLGLERACRKDPVLGRLARTWVAVCSRI